MAFRAESIGGLTVRPLLAYLRRPIYAGPGLSLQLAKSEMLCADVPVGRPGGNIVRPFVMGQGPSHL